jgi:hypothetical protein
MASNVITGQQWGPPAVGTRDGNWVWNGSNWICAPDCGTDGTPCPPMGPPVFSGPVAQPPWYPGANGGVSFGATAPANPVRGHMWWDGTSMWLFDGAAWVAIGGASGTGGAATGTTPPANPFNGQQWFNGSTLFVWDGNAWVPVSTTKSYVQATAPPSPNPGDLWYDGTVQRIWTGSLWATVGPGATVGPVPTTTQVFAITQTTSVAITQNTWEAIPFTGTPQIDTNSGWDAANKKYTPNKAGTYQFNMVGLGGGGAAAGVTAIALTKNDSGSISGVAGDPMVAIQSANTLAGNGEWVTCTCMIHLNGSTDFVRVWFLNTSQGLFYGAGAIPVLQGWLMP